MLNADMTKKIILKTLFGFRKWNVSILINKKYQFKLKSSKKKKIQF